MKLVTLSLLTVTLLSCSGETPKTSNSETQQKTEKSEPSTEDRLKRGVEADTISAPTSLTTAFNGAWFTVKYPADFKASPLSPTQKMDTYSYVDTDEATFVSPDGTVEFFVYSPQWSGDPKSYLEPMKNERIESDKTDAAKTDDPYAVTHRWVSFVDKEGKYTRSFHSRKSEVTHLVFGVKYTSMKHYERYKAAYTAFKKSLIQFAD